MSQAIIENVWRVGGGTWATKSVPLASVERDGNVFLARMSGGYVLVDCATIRGMHKIEANVREVDREALVDSSGQANDDASKWSTAAGGLTDLLLTHSHADHSEAASLWRSWHGVRTHLSDVGAEYFARGDAGLMGADAPQYQLRPFEVDHVVEDGVEFTVAGSTMTPLRAPGHTPDSVVYVTELSGSNVAFGGDLCFGGADWDPNPGNIGRVWASYESNLADYRESLKRMLDLEIDVLLPGHGHGIVGPARVRENLEGALATVEQFLNTPRIYAFGVPWRQS